MVFKQVGAGFIPARVAYGSMGGDKPRPYINVVLDSIEARTLLRNLFIGNIYCMPGSNVISIFCVPQVINKIRMVFINLLFQQYNNIRFRVSGVSKQMTEDR